VTVTDAVRTESPPDYAPAAVVDLELSEPLPNVPACGPDGRVRDRAWILVRLFTEPLGSMVLPMTGEMLHAQDIADAADRMFAPIIRDRVAAAGGDPRRRLTGDGITVAAAAPFVVGRERALSQAPSMSVVICTRDRPDMLARALDAVLAQRYPDFHVIVVDNAPSAPDTKVCVEQFGDRRMDYLVEPRPGLSWARNRGIAAATNEIVAFLDDDGPPDANWLAEIGRAFVEHPDADAVTGAIVPAEFETYPQELFERYGGHCKGRGFVPAVFSPLTAHEQSPLYPLPPFGAGGNMAIRRSCFDDGARFDVALGAGTRAQGAEDTQMLSRILLAGGTVVYQPSALVWHTHRRDMEGLRKVMRGYGIGLTAYYTSLLMEDPRRIAPMFRLMPTALRDALSRQGRSIGGIAGPFPKSLLSANRWGMARGPLCYLQSRVAARRLDRSAQR